MQLTDQKKVLISIVGPTAVGKTAKAIELAEVLGTEIISADSRQFYREMMIGTAKPSPEELDRVPHHFINSHDIKAFYSAGAFERDALLVLEQLFRERNRVICVGGSGLYLKALWQGFDEMPPIREGIRDQLNEEFLKLGISPLLEELERTDPVYFEQVDQRNHQRVIRALEVIRSTGSTFSQFRQSTPSTVRPFKNVKIGLEMEREELNKRIDDRMDQMIHAGLFEEVEQLYKYKEMNALQGRGHSTIEAQFATLC